MISIGLMFPGRFWYAWDIDVFGVHFSGKVSPRRSSEGHEGREKTLLPLLRSQLAISCCY
jgi:hypothetical protein